MRILGATCAIVLGLGGAARADRMVKADLDVTLPADWLYAEGFGDEDVLLYVGSDEDGVIGARLGRIEWGDYGLLECSRRFEQMVAENGKYTLYAGRPAWLPDTYLDYWLTMPAETGGVDTMVCTEGPDGDFLFVIVTTSTTSSGYGTATRLLEEIARATEWSRAAPAPSEYVTAGEGSGGGYVTSEEESGTEYVSPYSEQPYVEPTTEEPTPEAEPEPAPRDRALRVGIGLAYLAPAQMQESGYGLAASLGYDFGSTEARLRGEARGLFGVDSSAGFWADLHAHAVVRLFGDSFDGFTLSAHGGVGFDGIGKANTEMKVTVPYAASPQLGLRIGTRVDDGAYSLDGTFAVRIDGEPGGALRVGLSRLWDGPRRLASASIRYLRYADVVGHVSLMFGFRI